MTAAARNRNTDQMDYHAIPDTLDLPVKANVRCYAGTMAATDAAGNVAPATTATTWKVCGAFDAEANNTGGSAGAIRARVRTGVFKFANSAAGDAITNAERFTDCYAVDDSTVAKTDGTGTRSVAGRIIDVDSTGVWVFLGAAFLTGAQGPQGEPGE